MKKIDAKALTVVALKLTGWVVAPAVALFGSGVVAAVALTVFCFTVLFTVLDA